MKDSELKKILGDAFSLESTESRRRFMAEHKKRELNYPALLFMQLKYAGVRLAAVLTFLVVLFVFALLFGKTERELSGIRAVMALMPLPASLSLYDFGKSERCGMNEIEMTTRFSLRMLKSLRLVLLGIVGCGTLLSALVLVRFFYGCPLPLSLAVSGLPYLVTVSLCTVILRKWHAKENILGCFAASFLVGASALLPPVPDALASLKAPSVLVLLLAAFFLAATEIFRYIRESEDLQWNY